MTSISAKTVEEFMDKAGKKFGGGDLGRTSHGATFTYKKFQNGTLTGVVFTCPITKDFAEAGGTQDQPWHKQGIADIAKLAKDHETNHEASYTKAFNDWDPSQAATDLMANTYKNEAEAKKAMQKKLNELVDKLKAACETLHKSEGVIEVTGSYTATATARGAGGCG